MEKVPMTQPGFAALEIELKRRQSEDRHRIVAAISEAREHGDPKMPSITRPKNSRATTRAVSWNSKTSSRAPK
jgi:transcription elongation GreA/GreB family factor